MGAAIVRVWHGFMRSWNRPYRRLYCGGITSHFWVTKNDPAGEFRKGQKVFDPSKAQEILERGGRLRSIRTPRNRDLRAALSDMAKAMTVHHEVQYGFVRKRSCVDSARLHAGAKSVLSLDVSNAFEQVTRADVQYLLHHLYDVNSADAAQIAEVSCWGHRLYQGSPIAPPLWNARIYAAAVRLQALARANGLTVTIYADDVTISSRTWQYFSKRFIRTVIKILREEGIDVNPRKTHVSHPSPNNVGSTVVTGLTVDYGEHGEPLVRPVHRGRLVKKAYYLEWHIMYKNAVYSHEVAVDGAKKELTYVVGGILKWCGIAAHAPSRQLELHEVAALCRA